jgi:nucleoside-diphosphate-sugar epimerase
MAIRRLADCAVTGQPFALFGDGRQVRDFTFVSDVVNANIEAGFRDVAPGTVVNIAGGSHVSMTELIEIVEDLAGVPVAWERYSTEAGDVQKTGGTTEAAQRVLGWEPRVSLREGLTAQLEWARARNPMATVSAV